MGIFSRTRDIFAANMTELLDRSEDPAKMIRMIILEMEETLVEVRATAARSIADVKEMRRACERLDDLQAGLLRLSAGQHTAIDVRTQLRARLLAFLRHDLDELRSRRGLQGGDVGDLQRRAVDLAGLEGAGGHVGDRVGGDDVVGELDGLAGVANHRDVGDGRRPVYGRSAVGDERSRLWARWREIDSKLDAYAALRSSETAIVVLERSPDSPN